MLYDAFICHASEDKEDFVRPLAQTLKANHVEVWYDEFTLHVGDSLRRSIDQGLKQSRFGIVVLSPSFFEKAWPQWELDGLVQRELFDQVDLILPIWHEVSKKDVMRYSPSLADKIAVQSSEGIDTVVARLSERIKPEGSALIIARDCMIKFGYEPPVITDNWWLDVIEYSGLASMDTWPTVNTKGRWGFPLPPMSQKPTERGERLAWAGLQMLWQDKAKQGKICQITPPAEVLEFIMNEPGLLETCLAYPQFLCAYAPQLTIRGFGEEIEKEIEKLYQWSLRKHRQTRKVSPASGSALTINHLSPECDEWIALRHPTFGNYEPECVACDYVMSDWNGPDTQAFPVIDYVTWFLSKKSEWMPRAIREFLIQGLKDWAQWLSDGGWCERQAHDLGFKPSRNHDAMRDLLCHHKGKGKVALTQPAILDLTHRLAFSRSLLNLPESPEELVDRFLKEGFVEAWLEANARRMTDNSRKRPAKKKRRS